MGIDLYKDIDKPEDKTNVKVDNVLYDVVDVFKEWSEFANQHQNKDEQLEKAVEMLAPLANKGLAIVDKDFPFAHKDLGIFYTALLNAEVVQRLVLTKLVLDNLGYGYRLKKGILEIKLPDTHFVDAYGEQAQGGYIINRKGIHVILGQHAEGGTFINFGSAYFGGAIEGLFINYGTVHGCPACLSFPRTLCLNYVNNAEWQIFTGHRSSQRHLGGYNHAICHERKIEDKTLTELCNQLKAATDTSIIKDFVCRIETQCGLYR